MSQKCVASTHSHGHWLHPLKVRWRIGSMLTWGCAWRRQLPLREDVPADAVHVLQRHQAGCGLGAAELEGVQVAHWERQVLCSTEPQDE